MGGADSKRLRLRPEDEEVFRLVAVGGELNRDDVIFFNGEKYQYTLFMKVMKRLEDIFHGHMHGFWMNRSTLLQEARHMKVLVSEKSKEIVAFHVISPEGVIQFMRVFDEGRGIGRMLVDNARNEYEELVVYDVAKDAMLFWQKTGVRVGKKGKY